jgi:pimeloyl-ACP methyl ester carboxylesterase
MALALRSPDLVSDIVAVDNAPVDVSLSRDFPKYVRAMKKIQEAGVTRQSEADKILSEYEESLPIRQFLLGNMYLPEGEKVRKFRIPLNTLGKALDNLGDFPYKNPNEIRFEKPALFVRGTQSKYVPDDVLPLIGQFFPKFRLVDIDAGHWLISEQPEAFRQGECLACEMEGLNHILTDIQQRWLNFSNSPSDATELDVMDHVPLIEASSGQYFQSPPQTDPTCNMCVDR